MKKHAAQSRYVAATSLRNSSSVATGSEHGAFTTAGTIPVDAISAQFASSTRALLSLTDIYNGDDGMAGIDDVRADIRSLRKQMDDQRTEIKSDIRQEFAMIASPLTTAVNDLTSELRFEREKTSTQMSELKTEVTRIGTMLGLWGKILCIAIPAAIAIGSIVAGLIAAYVK